jgi:ABC-2 type transport system permease protein
MVAKYISLTWEMTKSSILSAMEYRVSFLVQVFGMLVNDIALVGLWIIFFQKFPSIHGWGFQDTAMLFAITTVNFAIVMILGRGAFELSKTISRGELDYYLSFPKNVLWHVSVSKTDISAIGDLLFGIAIFFFSGDISLEKTGLFIVVSALTALIFFNFIVITQSITFFVGNFEEAAEQMFHALLGFTLYPQTAFYGALKVIMLTIIPAFFIATLPVQLVQHFNLNLFLGLGTFWVVTTFLAVFLFRTGLRRYESGNLINVKS